MPEKTNKEEEEEIIRLSSFKNPPKTPSKPLPPKQKPLEGFVANQNQNANLKQLDKEKTAEVVSRVAPTQLPIKPNELIKKVPPKKPETLKPILEAKELDIQTLQVPKPMIDKKEAPLKPKKPLVAPSKQDFPVPPIKPNLTRHHHKTKSEKIEVMKEEFAPKVPPVKPNKENFIKPKPSFLSTDYAKEELEVVQENKPKFKPATNEQVFVDSALTRDLIQSQDTLDSKKEFEPLQNIKIDSQEAIFKPNNEISIASTEKEKEIDAFEPKNSKTFQDAQQKSMFVQQEKTNKNLQEQKSDSDFPFQTPVSNLQENNVETEETLNENIYKNLEEEKNRQKRIKDVVQEKAEKRREEKTKESRKDKIQIAIAENAEEKSESNLIDVAKQALPKHKEEKKKKGASGRKKQKNIESQPSTLQDELQQEVLENNETISKKTKISVVSSLEPKETLEEEKTKDKPLKDETKHQHDVQKQQNDAQKQQNDVLTTQQHALPAKQQEEVLTKQLKQVEPIFQAVANDKEEQKQQIVLESKDTKVNPIEFVETQNNELSDKSKKQDKNKEEEQLIALSKKSEKEMNDAKQDLEIQVVELFQKEKQEQTQVAEAKPDEYFNEEEQLRLLKRDKIILGAVLLLIILGTLVVLLVPGIMPMV